MNKYAKYAIVAAFTALLTPSAFSGLIKAGVTAGYYMPADSVLKEIYGKGGLMIGGFASYEPIRKIEIRGEYNYFRAKGEMTLMHDPIVLTLTPIVIGARYRLLSGKICPYLGAGIDFMSYKEELPERMGNVSDSTTGFHAEGGIYLNLISALFIDLNVRYVSAELMSFGEKVKLGGIRAGVALGYSF
jgi:hypothetical protein